MSSKMSQTLGSVTTRHDDLLDGAIDSHSFYGQRPLLCYYYNQSWYLLAQALVNKHKNGK